MIGGGDDFKDYVPLTPEGHRPPAEGEADMPPTVGCNVGSFEHLNVPNPQEGRAYRHIRTDDSNLRKKSALGYEVVPEDSPERAFTSGEGADLLSRNMQAAGVEGISHRPDLVLARIPQEKLARRTEEKMALARAQANDGSAAYTAHDEEAQRKFPSAQGKAIYYAEAGHGFHEDR